uniref:Uncharacterized protein n=1 Tax=Arundo donax TaxID=35708 RepID=A0A0A9BPB4_ARUDO
MKFWIHRGGESIQATEATMPLFVAITNVIMCLDHDWNKALGSQKHGIALCRLKSTLFSLHRTGGRELLCLYQGKKRACEVAMHWPFELFCSLFMIT